MQGLRIEAVRFLETQPRAGSTWYGVGLEGFKWGEEVRSTSKGGSFNGGGGQFFKTSRGGGLNGGREGKVTVTGGLGEGGAQVLAASGTAGLGARRNLVSRSFRCWKPRARCCAGGSGEGAAAGAGFSGGGRE